MGAFLTSVSSKLGRILKEFLRKIGPQSDIDQVMSF